MTTSFDTPGTGGTAPGHGAAPLSQTLDRGLRVLELLAEQEQPMSSAQIAAAVGVHRSIAYRIVRTLEDHRLVQRRLDGCWEPGMGLVGLARSVSTTLHRAATPELVELADDLGMTATLSVADRHECVTVLTVEPRRSQVHVAFRPGRRHAIDRGGPGVALLAGGPQQPDERPEVTAARATGYALTSGDVVPGLSSVAAPVVSEGGDVVASVAVLFLQDPPPDVEPVAVRVCQAARAIARELR